MPDHELSRLLHKYTGWGIVCSCGWHGPHLGANIEEAERYGKLHLDFLVSAPGYEPSHTAMAEWLNEDWP